MRNWLIAGLLAATLAAPAAAWETPARGSTLRADLMDALRPLAEWQYGAPVEFVVDNLRVSGNAAFADVQAQRPGGVPIERLDSDTGLPNLGALIQRSGRMWVPVHIAFEPTDVWYASSGFCPVWAAVLPEICD